MSRTLSVPLFPLAGAILFPRSQLPLHIFEPRYRAMVKDALAGDGVFALACLPPELTCSGCSLSCSSLLSQLWARRDSVN